jgi:NAD(P)H-dependent flavin oxidoreductase YrpB (nitropropane dioxygenase family)
MLSIFNSRYPILEACMNKGSTLELALAVHRAGGYPSLCSWTYNSRPELMQRDLDKFVSITGSNHIHLSFELYQYPSSVIQDIICSHRIATIEIIYGEKNSFRNIAVTEQELTKDLITLLNPIKAMGTRIFKRIYDTVDQATMDLHLLDGFCIKGEESAGLAGHIPVKTLFLAQRAQTPNAILIPYGGVGTAEQVKDYIELGAEIVAVGTVLALSRESTLSTKTKMTAIKKQSKDLKQFVHILSNTKRKQSALQFDPYLGEDDANGTIGLVRGMHGKKDGHVYLGQSIDYVNDLKSCQEIIQQLSSRL